MATHRERVSIALDLLTEGLSPYVEEKLRAIYRDNWKRSVKGSFRDDRGTEEGFEWDAHSLLTIMWDQWNTVFRHDLGHTERSLVSELREFRNKWAHQQAFDFDDAFRVLDSVNRLLIAVNASNCNIVQREKADLLESHVAEEVNTQVHNTAFQRNKWWIIVIYGMCCLLIIWHLALQSGNSENDAFTGNMWIVSVVLLIFVYLTYQQFKLEPPLLYGPRECTRCHRIVYRQRCPYCEGKSEA